MIPPDFRIVGYGVLLLVALAAYGAAACSSDDEQSRRCGKGTVLSGNQCVLEGGTGGGSGGLVGGGTSGSSAGGTAAGGTGGGGTGTGGVGGTASDAGADADASADAEGGCGELTAPWALFDAGAGPSLPSCVSAALGAGKNCGVNGNEDCCESRSIPCGEYDRSNDPLYPASVSPFRLDKFEVTVGRFRAFVQTEGGTKVNPPAAGAGAHPIAPGTGWQVNWNAYLADNSNDLKTKLKCHADATWSDVASAKEKFPINCVDWYAAFAFCIWDGGRLPTESEWNYVAAGGPSQDDYPWGSAGIGASDAVWKLAAPEAVGSRPLGYEDIWGHADLSGNVWEWVFDFWFPFYPLPCANCANVNPHVSGVRSMRGGSFAEGDPKYLTTMQRGSRGPTERVRDVGFRCARSL